MLAAQGGEDHAIDLQPAYRLDGGTLDSAVGRAAQGVQDEPLVKFRQRSSRGLGTMTVLEQPTASDTINRPRAYTESFEVSTATRERRCS